MENNSTKTVKRPTEAQLAVITKVINRLAPQFVFGHYDVDDIRQEGYIAALKGFAKYNEELPLENFMAVHLRRRFMNLQRDKYFRYEQPRDSELVGEWRTRNELKRNLMSPVDISSVSDEHLIDPAEILRDLAYAELVANIRAKLSGDARNDFMRMNDGVKIPAERRDEVRRQVREILNGGD